MDSGEWEVCSGELVAGSLVVEGGLNVGVTSLMVGSLDVSSLVQLAVTDSGYS